MNATQTEPKPSKRTIPPDLTDNERYQDTRMLIYSVAHQTQAALKTDKGIHAEFKELVSQGNLIFCEACSTYNPDRGAKFSSWLNKMLLQKLFNFGVTGSALSTYPKSLDCADWAVVDEYEPGQASLAEPSADFSMRTKTFSRDVQKVVRLFTDYPIELLGLDGSEPPRKVRGRLRVYLRSIGWSHPRINRVIKELKQVFSNGGKD